MALSRTLDVVQLRRLINQLFQQLEKAGVRDIPIRQAHYWSVFYMDAFDSSKSPEPVLGDLLDDLDDLKKEVEGDGDEDGVLLVRHAFHHLTGLMNFIAYADAHGDVAFVERIGARA